MAAITAYADRLTCLAALMLSSQVASREDHHRIFLLAQGVRVFRAFQAVRLLTKAGFNDAAGGVLRTLIEQAFVMCAIAKDANLMSVLVDQLLAEKHKAFSGLLKLEAAERPDFLTPDRIMAAMEESKKGSGFNAHFWAEKCDLVHVYHTLYRRLCTFAHGSMGGVSEYMKVDASGAVTSIMGDVQVSVENYVLTAASIVQDAVKLIVADDAEPELIQRLEDLSKEQLDLFDRWCKSEDLITSVDEIDLSSS